MTRQKLLTKIRRRSDMAFDFYVHGLWILGAVSMVFGALIAGNVAWIEGTTLISFSLSVLIAVLLLLFTGVCWISAAVNSRQEIR